MLILSVELEHITPSFAPQTNLWKLTPELAEALVEYNIPLGSSLDGPQELNDVQRFEGYYEKTMNGYELAKRHGLQVQFICIFTSYSVQFKEQIFNYFLENGLNFKLHPALPSLSSGEYLGHKVRRENHFIARIVKRVPLGTTYPEVVRYLKNIDTQLAERT